MKKKILLFITSVILIFLFKSNIILAVPAVVDSTITDNRANYINSQIPRFEKFEISFDIQNMDPAVTNFQFPYDSAPPAGVSAGAGITINGLFLAPGEINWNRATVQPGFWYENFSMALNDTAHAGSFQNKPDWIYAEGKEQWKIRFTPTKTGTWKYKIRVIDASGQSETDEMSFTVVSSNKKGFIRVNQADTRYFKFDNGEVFIPAGLSLITQGGLSTMWNNPKQAAVVENKLNLFRPWITAWQYMPIYGGYGCDRSSYFNYVKLAVDTIDSSQNIHSGRYAYKKIGGGTNYGDTTQFVNSAQPVKPYTQYKYSGWVKTVNLLGTGDAGARLYVPVEHGWVTVDSLRVKLPPAYSGWIDTTTTFKLTGDNDWTLVELTFTTKDKPWILIGGWQGNAISGTAYFDDLSLKEILFDGRLGPEQFDKGDMEFHEHFSQRASYHFDKLLEWAEKNNIYFKVSIEEKQEESYIRIKNDGTTDNFPPDNGNYMEYSGRAVGNSPLKRYEQYYWRYLIARWGYSTSIHSWEQFNETDPNDSTVYQLTNEFGDYMRKNNPNRQLITTSFWNDFPAKNFWGDTTYANIDYADFHKYLNSSSDLTGYAFWGSFLEKMSIGIETSSAHGYGGEGYSIKISGNPPLTDFGGNFKTLNIRGKGIWTIKYKMKTENLSGIVDTDNLLKGGIRYLVDSGSYYQNRVPRAPSTNYWDPNVPTGTYDWREFYDTFSLNDNKIHTLSFAFNNDGYAGGNAWIDNIEIIEPAGNNSYINGEFDLFSKKSDDLALYIAESSLSLGNIGKPVIWGETGLLENDSAVTTDMESELLKQDTAGVGFHNIIWSQINPSGVGVLYWHHQREIYDSGWIRHFKPYVLFMQGIPLNNGKYRDAKAITNNKYIRAWGQKDTANNRAHLWIQNKQHTWRNVINGVTIEPVTAGTITIPNMNNKNYYIEWWDTYNGTILKKEKAVVSDGNLNLSLPGNLTTDVAVKINLLW